MLLQKLAMDRMLHVLALGNRFSAAYRSIDDAVRSLGKITYRDEKTFKDAAEGIDFVRDAPFDVVVMPNPYGNERRRGIYESLRNLDFPVIVFDRGGLPRSWFFDVGFNADSPTYQASRWDLPITDDERRAVARYIQQVRDELVSLEAQGKRIGRDLLRQQLGVGDRKLLFVPLQRPSDTTTRFFSAPMASLGEFDALICEVAGRTQKHLQNWVVVAKTHPLEVRRPDIPVQFADKAHINDLLDAADAVLLLNSGTGLLSLCWDKPVLIAGTAYYSHPRLNRQVRSADEVEYSLGHLPSVDPETRDRFIHHLISRVYSFGTIYSQLVRQPDGAFRNITRHIEFDELRMPTIPKRNALLFVTSVIPWPITRGAAHRTDQMLRTMLDQEFTVDLICLNQTEPKSASAGIAERLRERYPSLRHIAVQRHPKLTRIRDRRPAEVLGKLRYYGAIAVEAFTWRAGTINSSRHCPPNLARLVRERLRRSSYDVAWFNYLRVMPRGLQTDTRVVCDLHDYQTERIRLDVLPRLHKWRRRYYLRRFFRSERAALSRCDQAVAISPVEARRIQKELNPRGEVVCIPATDDAKASHDQAAQYDLLYVGSRSDANVAGIIWFLEKCFPWIARDIPMVRLLIQGNIVDTPYLERGTASLPHGRNIVLAGVIDDLAAVYAASRVVICPVRHGTGMKIKMVEAMAYGKAIVATSAAAEGIATDLGLETYDDPHEFSAACVSTLKDPSVHARKKAISRAIFQRDHERSQLSRQLWALLRKELILSRGVHHSSA